MHLSNIIHNKKYGVKNIALTFKDSRSGFTLIEMMLAVSILAMVIVTIFTSLRIGINAWEKGKKTSAFFKPKGRSMNFCSKK